LIFSRLRFWSGHQIHLPLIHGCALLRWFFHWLFSWSRFSGSCSSFLPRVRSADQVSFVPFAALVSGPSQSAFTVAMDLVTSQLSVRVVLSPAVLPVARSAPAAQALILLFACSGFFARVFLLRVAREQEPVPLIRFAPAGLVLAHAPGNLWPVLRC
jgi:hypothetical protein